MQVSILCHGADMIDKIGEYRFGQDVKTARGLVELTPNEYAALWSSQGGKGIAGEQVFSGPQVTFNQYRWYLVVGAIDGKIYKLTLQYITDKQTEAHRVFEKTSKVLASRLGTPTQRSKTPNRYIWDLDYGNIFLVEQEAMGSWAINMLLTSIPH